MRKVTMALSDTVFADDLSGAAEIGATALRHGLTAGILIGQTAAGPEQVAVHDLNTRSCTEDRVPALVAGACARLPKEPGSGRLYKKVDSVLRGHVLVELTELVRRTGKRRALLVPANPALGRVILAGQYQIDGVPIHETDFRNDPQHPIRTADVVEILRPRPELLRVSVRRLGEKLPETGVIVGEAKSTQDVREWARRLDSDTLAAGAAAFYDAILKEAGYREQPARSVAAAGNQLLVSGSAADAGYQAISRLRQRGVPILPMPDSVFQSEETPVEALQPWINETLAVFERSPFVVVTIGRPPADRRRAPVLAARLACLAKAALEAISIVQVWIEGGETASSFVNKMGWRRLTVCGEIDRKVAQLVPHGLSSPILNLKPGSYPWPEGFFHRG